MYDIFTYISHKTSTKCRLIYHTLILWVYVIKKNPLHDFRAICHPQKLVVDLFNACQGQSGPIGAGSIFFEAKWCQRTCFLHMG